MSRHFVRSIRNGPPTRLMANHFRWSPATGELAVKHHWQISGHSAIQRNSSLRICYRSGAVATTLPADWRGPHRAPEAIFEAW